MQPHFIIIGAQKSGTTFLQKCIKEHPQVFMPNGESPIFENPDYKRSEVNPYFSKIFKGVPKTKVLGIKRPSYLSCKLCTKRIYEHLPETKLIAVLRNPAERFVSAYFHYMKMGFIPIIDINQGLINIINGEYAEKYPRSAEIFFFGFYYTHLKNYFKYYNNKNMLILFYDDLKINPLDTIKKTYHFLNIAPDYIPKNLKAHPQLGSYSYNRIKYRSAANKFIYRYNKEYTRLQNRHLNKFKSSAIRLYLALDNLFSKISQPKKPRLNSLSKKILSSMYLDEIKSLEELLNTDIKNWKII